MTDHTPQITPPAQGAAAQNTLSSPWRLAARRFSRHKLAWISLVILLLFAIASAFAPLVAHLLGTDAQAVDLFSRYAPPSAEHPLGTDELGRDTLLRLLYGGQVSLMVGVSSALCAAIIGTFIGIIAGFRGGWLDGFLMRFTDGIISLPLLPLLIVLAAIDPGKLGIPREIINGESFSLYRIILIIALFGWTTVARLVRAATLALREREFVMSARALGAGPGRIIWRHILPNVVTPIIIATTLAVGNVILMESVLSFLGLGIQPPVPSWGNMLTHAQEFIWDAPLLALWPGLLIFVTVIAVNFLGDGLQDALDPRADSDIAPATGQSDTQTAQ
ncbi:ABC transporter permease [Thalassospira marina]|uniref:NAD synthetase n=1 Tax=Thalassospira marina TaxID=2048283 RepID=A0A2N3KMF9_9PROT|nr:ABC transporter permease [Thalassospira marina]PKR51741.1 NAD synthetase [Thalassospira marina]